MRKILIALAVLAAPVSAEDKPALTPSEIVAAAPKSDWTAIAASDLLVMDLTPDAKNRPRRVVIQLLPPPFSQGWIGNIRLLAAARWWDGTSINRVQDNYVVQWGDGEAEDKAKAKKLPKGLGVVPDSEYESKYSYNFNTIWVNDFRKPAVVPRPPPVMFSSDAPRRRITDPYSGTYAFVGGFPIALISKVDWVPTDGGSSNPRTRTELVVPDLTWPIHCYAMVGVGRDMPPDTGSGAELYTVIGHAPRHLDRNIALVGRVIEGIEHLSSMPRGKGPLGFFDLAQGDERVPILSVQIGSEVKDLPTYEYLSTESASFAAYADARANRRDPFFIRPAGGADICNIPVPVRRVKQ